MSYGVQPLPIDKQNSAGDYEMRQLEVSKRVLLLHLNMCSCMMIFGLLNEKQQTAVTKITGLLRVGFGGAGADIISKVRTRNGIHAREQHLYRGFLKISTMIFPYPH